MKSIRRGRRKTPRRKNRSYRKRRVQRRRTLYAQPYPQQQQPGVLAKVGDAALFGFGANLGIQAANGVMDVGGEVVDGVFE